MIKILAPALAALLSLGLAGANEGSTHTNVEYDEPTGIILDGQQYEYRPGYDMYLGRRFGTETRVVIPWPAADRRTVGDTVLYTPAYCEQCRGEEIIVRRLLHLDL